MKVTTSIVCKVVTRKIFFGPVLGPLRNSTIELLTEASVSEHDIEFGRVCASGGRINFSFY